MREVSPSARSSRKSVYREVSPAGTERTVRTRRRSSGGTTIIEKKIIRETDEIEFPESNSVHTGPLALVRQISADENRKTDIKDEIRMLEIERDELRGGRSSRARSKSRRRSTIYVDDDRRELVVDKGEPDIVEIRKDKKGRMSLVAR